ncbi:MAG TPA: AMP-binding protein, partial [Bacilli bacterium]|nr:AMP-binding protein [Bacilli bacterium]
MKLQALPSRQGEHNLKSYEETAKNFDWKSVEKEFSWSTTGKVNVAYECIDRHVESDKKDKIALLYSDANRDEKYTFEDMKIMSNRAGNVLKSHGVEKGDRVFIFMPRSPELYFALLSLSSSRSL